MKVHNPKLTALRRLGDVRLWLPLGAAALGMIVLGNIAGASFPSLDAISSLATTSCQAWGFAGSWTVASLQLVSMAGSAAHRLSRTAHCDQFFAARDTADGHVSNCDRAVRVALHDPLFILGQNNDAFT